MDRRPIKARSLPIFQRLATLLAKSSITPNQISVASIFFATWVPLAIYLSPPGSWIGSVIAVCGIQLRLICNLLDGMVAIEGGKKSPVGGIYNEFPDRVADTLILVGVCLAQPLDIRLMTFGVVSSMLAISTAYTRVLGASLGTPHYFLGPMAKQHRMAILTIALLVVPVVTSFVSSANVMIAVHVVISLGCIATVFRRLRKIGIALRSE
jgi:phosphatidylglycerophosphate synthase